jgi:hypothetical protein
MVDPSLVMFAIQAGVALGRKTYDVLVESTQAAPLLLPLGSLAGSVQEADAVLFFNRPENRALVEGGGPYHGLSREQLVVACATVRQVGDRLGDAGPSAAETIRALHAFDQHRRAFGPRSPWQRIAGTVVEIGIDYFVANPQAMGRDSPSRRIVLAFLAGIRDVPFAEGDPVTVVGDTLLAGLRVLGDDATLVADDARLQALLGGVTASLAADLRTAASLGERQRREDLFRRVTAGLLRGGADAVAGHVDLFVRGRGQGGDVVRSAVTGVLAGVRDRDDLFSNEALAALVRTALGAVAGHATLLADDRLVRAVIERTVAALTADPARALFSTGSVEAVTRAALAAVADNVATLVDPAAPARQAVAEALVAMGHGLASELAGGTPLRALLSTDQLVELTRLVLDAVARHPERLLRAEGGDARRTALAQVLGSLARALGREPTRLVTGSTFLALVRTALPVALRNLDRLVDLKATDPATNLLFKVVAAVGGAALGERDRRRLLDRDVFVETVRVVLPTVSAHLDALPDGQAEVVEAVLSAALDLSTAELEGRINGDTLPGLVDHLLRARLRGELALDDRAAVVEAAVAELGAPAAVAGATRRRRRPRA